MIDRYWVQGCKGFFVKGERIDGGYWHLVSIHTIREDARRTKRSYQIVYPNNRYRIWDALRRKVIR